MKKILLYSLCMLGSINLAKAQNWQGCTILENNHEVYMTSFSQLVCDIYLENSSQASFPEKELKVYLITDDPNVEIIGGTCHEALASGQTIQSSFGISPALGASEFSVDCFTVAIKLQDNFNPENYCIEPFEICLNELSIDQEGTALTQTPIAVKSYDLSGREIIGAYRGIYIQKTFYENGYIHTEKRYRAQ